MSSGVDMNNKGRCFIGKILDVEGGRRVPSCSTKKKDVFNEITFQVFFMPIPVKYNASIFRLRYRSERLR